MAGPVRLAIDYPRVPRDLRCEYAVQGRMPRAGESALDVSTGSALDPRPSSRCSSRPRLDGAAPARSVEVAKEPKIQKGRFA